MRQLQRARLQTAARGRSQTAPTRPDPRSASPRMGAAHLARGRPGQDDRLLPRPPDHPLGWNQAELMIPGRIPARAVVPVLIGAVILPSCTSASGAASPSRSATPASTHCTPGSGPPARMGAAMTYDAATKAVVLFGGTRGDGSPPLDDTWTWDGCRWTQAKPATSPPGRSFGNLASDPSSGKVILFGGGHGNSD